MPKEIAIVHQDEELLVADKPAGLLTVAGDAPSLDQTTQLSSCEAPAARGHAHL